jgi:putative transposase
MALREQLAVLHRTQPHGRMRKLDSLFWVWLSRIWDKWKQPLLIVRPDTVVRWHRQGFAFYWIWISKRKSPGRIGVSLQIRDLMSQM